MFRFTLKNEKKKQICPNCHKRRFVRYIDLETGEFLPSYVGRCDREVNCGYHLKPKDYFTNNNIEISYKTSLSTTQQTKTTTNYHTKTLIRKTNLNYKNNNFIKYLHTLFSISEVNEIINRYKIGTSKHWKGATIFWQIDELNNIRGGKVMLYNEYTGKRTKFFTWVHSILIKKNIINSFNLKQCLFGLHLINSENKPIAIVESEKTACIMSQFFKKYTWLATGGLSVLSESNLKIIKNKDIILYPDLGIDNNGVTPFVKWNNKRKELNNKGFNISISALLEDNATTDQINKGYDIADYFVNQ